VEQKEAAVPTIAVGLCNMADVLRAIHEEAERSGVFSRACRISPGLIGVQQADLARLAARPPDGVHYDGRKLWIRGVDYAVRP
jgi:hypothetical protein